MIFNNPDGQYQASVWPETELMDIFSSHLIKFINIMPTWFLMGLYQSNIKRNLFRRMFNSSPELLRPVHPIPRKGLILWMFPVLFSGIALTCREENKGKHVCGEQTIEKYFIISTDYIYVLHHIKITKTPLHVSGFPDGQMSNLPKWLNIYREPHTFSSNKGYCGYRSKGTRG